MEKHKSDRTSLGLPRMYLLWKGKGGMTEQIKDSMETCRIIVHATEEELLNQHRYNDAKEIEVALNDMLKAFRSLNAWKEVLQELEILIRGCDIMLEDNNEDMFYGGKKRGYEKVIEVINQHLAEIEEGEET